MIIGGGIIGLAIAREFGRRGCSRVTLVDKGVCAQESSWAAAGMLGPQVDADERDAMMDLCMASRDLYPALAADLADETGFDVELDRTGTMAVAFQRDEMDRLRARAEWQAGMGLAADEVTAREIREAEPWVSTRVVGGVYFANDWQVENRKLCEALKVSAEKSGVRIIENTEATEVIEHGGRVTGVRTTGGEMSANVTVIATGAWTSLIKMGAYSAAMNVRPIRGQMIAYEAGKLLPRHILHSEDGYLVPRRDGRLLAGASVEDVRFEKGTTPGYVAAMMRMAIDIVPDLGELEIADQWSGLRPKAADGLPVLGAIPGLDGLYFATGHYRNGILLAPITAEIVADDILESKRSPFLDGLGPNRFTKAAAGV